MTASKTISLVAPDAPASSATRTVDSSSDFDPFEGRRSIPVFAWLLRYPDITLLDALVYGALAFFRGRGSGRECRPSVGTIAVELGIDERNCRRRIAKLERLGLIRRCGRHRRTNLFVFVNPGPIEPGSKQPGSKQPRVISALHPRVKTTRKYRVKTTPQSEQREEQVTEHAFVVASLSAEIETLEARFGDREVTRRAREACARSRSGDTAWLQTLEKLGGYEPAVSRYALQQFADHHADGSKGPKYLLGIAKRVATDSERGVQVPPAVQEQTFAERVANEVVCDH
jgi:DNA-binding Lrp family transcriptional regulator